jgi:hypothetical protein
MAISAGSINERVGFSRRVALVDGDLGELDQRTMQVLEAGRVCA